MAAEPKTPAPPPNLRVSDPDDKGGECETCTHYVEKTGACKIHPPAVVDGEWVCDDFEQGGRPDSDVSRQPRTLHGAAAHAREYFAAKRAQQ